VPGKVQAVTRTLLGEVDVNFEPGIGTRKGGQEVGDGVVPSAGVAYPGGGGFTMRWPLLPQDEVVGMVADRNTERWRQTKLVGQAHSFSQRHHDLSDTVVFPFRLTPPTPTPPAAVTNETTDWVLQGPLGDIMRVSPTGPVTIRTGPDGVTVATLTFDVPGKITLTPAPGQTVECGGALELVLADAFITVMDAVMLALVNAGAGAGYAGAGAAQTTWLNTKNTIKTLVTRGS
jgi:hypothetical protein